MRQFAVRLLFLAVSAALAVGIAEAAPNSFLTVSSRYNCCLGSAAIASLPAGESTITYVSGAWNNHTPSGVFLGYVRVEIPELGVVFPLGTDEQVGFSSYAAAETAAIGDSERIVNGTGAPVTAYFYVWDGCAYGGWCGDNAGDVLIDITNQTVSGGDCSWDTVKARFR